MGFITIAMSNAPANLDVPKNPADRRAWIKFRLETKGLSLRGLARIEGVTHQAMSHALLGPSSHLQPVIAEAIGLTVHQLFPEWYDGNGERLGRIRERQRSTRRHPDNVQSGEAA